MFKIILGLLIALFIIAPIVGIFFFFRYVIKKSRANQKPEVLEKEKRTLFEKVHKAKANLIPWKPEYLVKLSNQINYNYVKGFTKRFNGTIMNSYGEPIIAFRRLDRGHNFNSQIVATTSNDLFYLNKVDKDIQIYKNDVFFGIFEGLKHLKNPSDDIVGQLKPHENNNALYRVDLNNKETAQVIKNTDRRQFVSNPFYDIHPTNILEVGMFDQQDVKIDNALVFVERDLNENEYDWLLALAMFESVYYGIDFLQ